MESLARREKTYWNGERCKASKVRVRVGKAEKDTFWYKSIEGQERSAVEVIYGGECFYLDNADGRGWNKVTRGKGSPGVGHRSLAIDETFGVFPED